MRALPLDVAYGRWVKHHPQESAVRAESGPHQRHTRSDLRRGLIDGERRPHS
jgi:hypothetical protein